MAITYLKRIDGSSNNIVYLETTDSIATSTAAGYITTQTPTITSINNGAWTWETNDFIILSASDGVALATINAGFTALVLIVFSTTVIGAPVVVGDFAVFASTGGNIEDLGYLPSNAAKTRVVMANGATVVNELSTFADTTGTVQSATGYNITSNLLSQPAVSALTAHAGGTQAAALALTKVINNVTTVATAGDSVKLPASAAGLEITIANNGVASMQVYGAGTDTINGVATATGVAQLPGQVVVYTCAVAGNWIANVSTNPNPVLFASVPITAAQFNGMYAAPMLLIAAPGANKLIAVEKIELVMTFVSAAYAAGGVVAAQYDSTVHGAGVYASNSEAAADFFAGASTTFSFISTSGNTVGALPFSTTVNKGLYLSNLTQAFTTGDSTWVAKIYYRVVNTVGAL